MPGASALQPMSIHQPPSLPAQARREAWVVDQSSELASPEPSAEAGVDLEAGEGRPQPAAAQRQPNLAAEACKCLAKAIGGTLCCLGAPAGCGALTGGAIYGITYGIAYAASHDKDLAGLFALYFGSLAGGAGAVVGCAVACQQVCGDNG